MSSQIYYLTPINSESFMINNTRYINILKGNKALREGSFGIVYLVEKENDKTHKKYIIKLSKKFIYKQESEKLKSKELEIKGLENTEENKEKIEEEILKNPPKGINPVEFREIEISNILDPNQPVLKMLGFGFCNNHLIMLMDYYPTDLKRFFSENHSNRNVMNEKFIKKICFKLFTGLAHIHSLGVIHRDIKPENILYDPSTETVKIADFGLSIKVDTFNTNKFIDAGTQLYKPIETLKYKLIYGSSFDIWNLGVTISELITGDNIFHGANNESIIKSIEKFFGPLDNKGSNAHSMPNASTEDSSSEKADHLSKKETLKAFIESKAKDVGLSDDFYDLLAQTFIYPPFQRISAQKALEHPWFKDCNKSFQ